MTEPVGHPPKEEWRACAVCSRVLARKTEYVGGVPVGRRWEHEAIDVDRGVDHPPVPVPYDQLASVAMVCDFCSEPDPTWELPVGDFAIEKFYANGDDWGSTSNWMACGVCADLIRAESWPALTRRAAKYLMRNGKLPDRPEVRAVVDADLKAKYSLVRKHTQGTIRLADRAITVETLRQIVEGRRRHDALGEDS